MNKLKNKILQTMPLSGEIVRHTDLVVEKRVCAFTEMEIENEMKWRLVYVLDQAAGRAFPERITSREIVKQYLEGEKQ